MKRRSFLKAGTLGVAGAISGVGLLTWTPRSEAATITKTYYITDGTIAQPDGVMVYFRGFSESSTQLNVPARPMIVNQNDTVRVTIVNTLSTTHSFVIDGVVNSGPIGGGQTKTIQFTPSTPGTFMFYDSQNAPYNRVTGLHGAFAVMPQGSSNELYSGSPTFVKQMFWVLNDCDPSWNSAIQLGQRPSSSYKPRYFTINGLSSRPPGAPDADNPAIDAMVNLDTAPHGSIGDRTLIRVLNAGMGSHSMHWHANHVEWLTQNGQIRPHIWLKDIVSIRNNMGGADVIYPFEMPPDAYPPVTTGVYPMHLHNEMTQTAGGGLYMFGTMTDIYFE